ncbi:MAG: Helix-turn-helix domain [Gaiellales bacterium]|nr:Helix-turn-helix domain [Gaiellales bacterium]
MTRLEQLRLDAGWTPEQLSEKSGVAPATIRRLENGKGGQVRTLVDLAEALDARPSELLRDAADFEKAA